MNEIKTPKQVARRAIEMVWEMLGDRHDIDAKEIRDEIEDSLKKEFATILEGEDSGDAFVVVGQIVEQRIKGRRELQDELNEDIAAGNRPYEHECLEAVRGIGFKDGLETGRAEVDQNLAAITEAANEMSQESRGALFDAMTCNADDMAQAFSDMKDSETSERDRLFLAAVKFGYEKRGRDDERLLEDSWHDMATYIPPKNLWGQIFIMDDPEEDEPEIMAYGEYKNLLGRPDTGWHILSGLGVCITYGAKVKLLKDMR